MLGMVSGMKGKHEVHTQDKWKLEGKKVSRKHWKQEPQVLKKDQKKKLKKGKN